MKANNHSEASTEKKLDATDSNVGTFNFNDLDSIDWQADMAAVDDERFERDCAQSTKDVFREVKHLEGYVQRGVRSVRNAEIDSDSLNGLAQQALTRTGDRSRSAWKLGRAWALANLPTYAELALRDRRHERERYQRDARIAKENWERGDTLANLELFCDQPA
jgi:hypothetical protein